jgi:hypothetical protein
MERGSRFLAPVAMVFESVLLSFSSIAGDQPGTRPGLKCMGTKLQLRPGARSRTLIRQSEENLEPPFGFAQGRLRTHGAQRSAEYFIRVFFAEKKLLQVLIKTNLIRRGL